MAARATQLLRHALLTPRPAARTTQLAAAVLLTPIPAARVTQLRRDTSRSTADLPDSRTHEEIPACR